jgi:hypothetical protein
MVPIVVVGNCLKVKYAIIKPSMTINKKNIPLIIALAIPVLMIILVAAFIYLPGIDQKPKENFLYLSGSNNYYPYGQQQYQVTSDHLIQNPAPTSTPSNYPVPDNAAAHFYIYDVTKNTATELTFTQAKTYTLDSSNTSADGYTIQQGNSGGGDGLFGGVPDDYNNWFIIGHNRSIKLNLKLTGTDYDNFQFLGWVN